MQQRTRRVLDERGPAAELALQHHIDTIRSAAETAQRKIDMLRDDGLGGHIRFGKDHAMSWQTAEAYFNPSWTPFQADRGRCFSGIVDDGVARK